jgi:hypothetical protein
MNPKPREDLADGRLRRIQHFRRTGEAPLAQQDAQHLEIAQPEIAIIQICHDLHSRSGMEVFQRLCDV